MKRLIVLIACVVFLMGTTAFADEKTAANPEQSVPTAAAPAQKAVTAPAKMNASGKIVELSEAALVIQRVVKGNTELMQFSLEKPIKYKVGDKVKVSYIEKDGVNIAIKVSKQYKTAKAAKPAPAKQAPAAKPLPAPAS